MASPPPVPDYQLLTLLVKNRRPRAGAFSLPLIPRVYREGYLPRVYREGYLPRVYRVAYTRVYHREAYTRYTTYKGRQKGLSGS